MIARALSFAHDLLDLTTLARAVHRLASERDALALLAGQLEGELQHATDTAEALRAELADRTAPRDAASPEAEVLRLAYRADRSWRDDVEAPALRQQLQAAEVELAAARSGLEMARTEIALLEAVADDARAQRKRDLARWAERAACYRSHALTLARRLRAFVALHGSAVSRLILHAPADVAPPSSTQDQPVTCGARARGGFIDGLVCTLPTGHEGAHEAESSLGMLAGRWADADAPPPTQPSERRPVEPAPERAVRVAVGGGQ